MESRVSNTVSGVTWIERASGQKNTVQKNTGRAPFFTEILGFRILVLL